MCVVLVVLAFVLLCEDFCNIFFCSELRWFVFFARRFAPSKFWAVFFFLGAASSSAFALFFWYVYFVLYLGDSVIVLVVAFF